jgi:protein-S-isoprenylcysteine O-methyltransferase Ste14
MKPLVAHDPLAATAFWVTAGAWWLGELVFSIRTTLTHEGRRSASFFVLTVATAGAIPVAAILANQFDHLALPGPGWWPVVVGLTVTIAGIGLRIWAIRELGRFFTYAVLIHEGHRVIDTGPYRRIRHPSYTGLLMGMLGLGIALGTWVSVPACFVPALAAFTWRLLSEEQVLAAELGEPYRAYMRRTRRLVPGLW